MTTLHADLPVLGRDLGRVRLGVGGPSAWESTEPMRNPTGLNIVAADLNTASPPQDVGGLAAHLCTHMTMEAMPLPARWFGLLKAV